MASLSEASLHQPRVRTISPGWTTLLDPDGRATSLVPADRVAYYVAKGFRALEATTGAGIAPGEPEPLVPARPARKERRP